MPEEKMWQVKRVTELLEPNIVENLLTSIKNYVPEVIRRFDASNGTLSYNEEARCSYKTSPWPAKKMCRGTRDSSSSDSDDENVTGPSTSNGEGNVQKRARNRQKKVPILEKARESSLSESDDSTFSCGNGSNSPESLGSLEENELEYVIDSPSTADTWWKWCNCFFIRKFK